MGWHHRALDFAIARPLVLAGICAVLVAGTFFAYKSLGSDLLPEMDEGGFILDYIMPAGSSLQSTSKVLGTCGRNSSRHTGGRERQQAHGSANGPCSRDRGKHRRHDGEAQGANGSRGIDEVISEVRAKVKAAEPQLDTEYIQVLQDNINDLSNAPEPIQIKLFSEDISLLSEVAPRVADEIGKVKGVVSIENGIDNTISGPATNFQVDPQLTARLGFTPQEAAEDATSILDGVEVKRPCDLQRPALHREGAPGRRDAAGSGHDSEHCF